MAKSMIPSSSQTVGPYFRIGLEYLFDPITKVDATDVCAIAIRGTVLDRDRAPVPDAMLEFWSASRVPQNDEADSTGQWISERFRRAGTDEDGNFSIKIPRPIANALQDGRPQAPHIMVLLFARGLQRHLISRVYLGDETGNETDLVLLAVPPQRRRTLIAAVDGDNAYRWNVILQGAEETVFFAW